MTFERRGEWLVAFSNAFLAALCACVMTEIAEAPAHIGSVYYLIMFSTLEIRYYVRKIK